MKITAVDSAKDLFLVEDIFAPELLSDLSTDNIDWQVQGQQENFPRGVIDANTCPSSHSFYRMAEYLNGAYIESYFTKFFKRDTLLHVPRIWYDEPGFSMKEHIDGDQIHQSIQDYLYMWVWISSIKTSTYNWLTHLSKYHIIVLLITNYEGNNK